MCACICMYAAVRYWNGIKEYEWGEIVCRGLFESWKDGAQELIIRVISGRYLCDF